MVGLHDTVERNTSSLQTIFTTSVIQKGGGGGLLTFLAGAFSSYFDETKMLQIDFTNLAAWSEDSTRMLDFLEDIHWFRLSILRDKTG